mgnify:CR=1 FL=1
MKYVFYLLGEKWHYCIFDRAENKITRCKTDEIKCLDNFGIIQVRITKKLNHLDVNGNWIW